MKIIENTMDEKIKAELKEKLLKEKKELEERLSNIGNKNEHDSDDYNAEFRDMGDDLEQNALEVAEYEKDLGLEHQFESTLALVNKALKKMEDGTYGVSEKTGKPIALGRLQSVPWAENDVDEA